MEISFWGVRGTIPAPGPEFNHYGGNTSCVSVRPSDGGLIILDAGTGITVLGRALMSGGEPSVGGGGRAKRVGHNRGEAASGRGERGEAGSGGEPSVGGGGRAKRVRGTGHRRGEAASGLAEPRVVRERGEAGSGGGGWGAGEFGRGTGRATVLLTHAHWDHIQGFPFFAPVYVRGNHFTIYGMSQSPSIVEGILEGQMDPHFSPVHSLRNLGAEIEFRAVQEGAAFEVEGVTVRARSNPHGRSSSLAYRLEDSSGSVVYAPDAGYEHCPSDDVCELYRGADLLIHDTTYTPEDQEARRSRGQSSILSAARAAACCQAKSLVMFHYDQDYSDEQVEELERRCRQYLDQQPGGRKVRLIAAREGLTLSTSAI